MKIETYDSWSGRDIRSLCIKKDWYGYGTNEDYEKMLNFVTTHKPTTMNIYKVAKDIFEHCDKGYMMRSYNMDENEVIESIMFEINDCIFRFYTIIE